MHTYKCIRSQRQHVTRAIGNVVPHAKERHVLLRCFMLLFEASCTAPNQPFDSGPPNWKKCLHFIVSKIVSFKTLKPNHPSPYLFASRSVYLAASVGLCFLPYPPSFSPLNLTKNCLMYKQKPHGRKHVAIFSWHHKNSQLDLFFYGAE